MKVNDDLNTLAEMALSNMRRQLDATGNSGMRWAVRMPDGKINWIDIPETLHPLLNDAEAKSVLFGMLRSAVEHFKATAVVIATDSWAGVPTEKQKRMAEEEPDKLQRLAKTLGPLSKWVEEGLATRAEAICVTVQTPEDVLIIQHLYQRSANHKRILWGDRHTTRVPQADFMGNTKMYGYEKEVENDAVQIITE